MRLIDLDPHWIEILSPTIHQELATTVEKADGIAFLCPKCYADRAAGKDLHVHLVICWRPRVAPEREPGPGRWEFVGTGFEDLTLVAWSSSVRLMGGCDAHFLIRNGEVVFC